MGKVQGKSGDEAKGKEIFKRPNRNKADTGAGKAGVAEVSASGGFFVLCGRNSMCQFDRPGTAGGFWDLERIFY